MANPRLRRSIHLLAGALVLGATGMVGCLNRPIEPIDSKSTHTYSDKLPQSRVEKIDLLLMIDNSGSMADKQAILADAVPDLVKGLVAPQCLDKKGVPIAAQPAHPLDPCPKGSAREFDPIQDIHIGIISSSLGGHGATFTCATTADKSGNPENDDRAHLLSRKPDGGAVSTWKNQGFLAWDPGQKLDPPGESEIGDIKGTTGLVPTLRDMVQGVGQVGCGYEAQLESWYRFLVDPEPYASISVENGKAVPTGVDHDLLKQRADFLRPDSMVAIIMLSDENDCSIRDGGVGYLAAQRVVEKNGKKVAYHLPRARHECSVDINDACCKSCGSPRGDCPVDPDCEKPMTDDEDPSNLRCFKQKQRFGIDFLQPLDRYTTALGNALIPNREGELVGNPLFPGANGTGGDPGARTPEMHLVFLAGIVGVPWQDVARRNKDGDPDLLHGLDKDGNEVGGFQTVSELMLKNPRGRSGWDEILGDPAHGIEPVDPFMRESRDPRKGQNPATGDPIIDPSAPLSEVNGVNGREYDTSKNSNGDLQYACRFKLPEPRNCADGACDCDAEAKNPLCLDDQGNLGETQRYAKAYPGLRELGVLKGAGDQGIVASVCAAQMDDPGKANYGYHPAIQAIVERLKSRLNGPCLPRQLHPDGQGQVSCLLIEARKTAPGECSCDAPAVKARHDPLLPDHQPAVDQAKNDPAAAGAGWNCFCEIEPVAGDALLACQTDASRNPTTADGKPVDGWCYVDATTGNPDLIESCSATEPQKLRFVGEGEPLDNSTVFITCSGE
ncbi:MAG: hypothetical protein U0359_13765 [Byssovorax sp.]